MNSVAKHREALRNNRRKEELAKFKKNMRNFIYYNTQNNPYSCALCQDDRWISLESTSHILELTVSIFNHKHICDKHLQILFEVTLRCVQNEPSIYCKLFEIANKLSKEVVIRKILLLLQLFDSRVVQNQRIWDQILNSFTCKDQFVVRLMDCAYSFNEWGIMEQDQNWDMQIKSICFTTVLNIFGRHPFLFINYLDEYPLNLLLSQTKDYHTVNLLCIFDNILNSQGQQQVKSIANYIYKGFALYLSDIKHVPQTLQVFFAILKVASSLAKVGFFSSQMQSDLLYLIRNNCKFKVYAFQLIMQIFAYFNKDSNQQQIKQELSSLSQIKGMKSRMQIEGSKQMQVQ